MTGRRPRTRKRRADGRFQKWVEGHSPAVGLMPLVHITRAYAFDDMIAGDGLEPALCEVFRQKLIYFFYGRPSYRAKDGNNARLEYEWPIVLIFDPNKIAGLKRIFPFDTGAFKLGYYSEFFDKAAILKDFELAPVIESAQRLVSAYYSDNREYYQGMSRKNVDIGQRQFEAQGVHELARLPGKQGNERSTGTRDERSSAFEIQVTKGINFEDALLAVVLPEPYLDDNDIAEGLKRWQVKEIRSYQTLHNMSGEAWVGQIYKIVYDLYHDLGYLPR
jgi:hypothetical protein